MRRHERSDSFALAIVPYTGHRAKAEEVQVYSAYLPELLAHNLLPYLDAQGLCNVAKVSYTFNKLANEDKHWAELCRVQWGVAPDSLKPPPDPVKTLYEVGLLSY